MTLDRYRSVAIEALQPFVAMAIRLGLTPDAVSLIAFILAIGGGVGFAFGGPWYLVGAVLVAANGWLDLLDGELARALETASPGGDLLDHVLDRYADVILVAGLAAGIGRYALGFAAVTGVLLTSYLGTQAEAVGLDRVYGGVLGRGDRLVLIAAVGLLTPFVTLPGPLTLVGWLLVLFAIVGHATALQRFYFARKALQRD
jgi:archaetidylinositol phosphate synthase